MPGTEVLVPSGAAARVAANLAALRLSEDLNRRGGAASAAEQQVLAAWSGWGAVPEVFDRNNARFAAQREEIRGLLSRDAYRAAEASILNAHYTDPAIAAVMWQSVVSAGFTGGRVLEPGCGAGLFIGKAPTSAQMVGVEVDPATAAIAAVLYPSAHIRNEGFEASRLPPGSFAATIGNVPFGKYAVHDPIYNAAGHSIHNAFIIKSLAMTAPGGYVTVLTSRWTLDALSDKARAEMAEAAELIAALRLPSQAFTRVAGTEAVTDLLVLRRRTEAPPAGEHPGWLDVEPMQIGPETVGINGYFHDHPEHILGEMDLNHGLYGALTLTVTGASGNKLAEQMAARLDPMIAAAVQRGRGLTATAAHIGLPQDFPAGLRTPAAEAPTPVLKTLRYNASAARFEEWAGFAWEPVKVPASRQAETRALLDLRDAAQEVIGGQQQGRDPAERAQLRRHLGALYDNYVRTYGPINRFTLVVPSDASQEVHDAKAAELQRAWRETMGEPGRPFDGPPPPDLIDSWDVTAWKTDREPYKTRLHAAALKHDPSWSLLSALELFDEATQTALKAPIFSADVIAAAPTLRRADGPAQALAISLDRTGHVDLAVIGELLGTNAATARTMLAGLVYPSLTDPDDLVPAPTALSGDVRAKLATATAAAFDHPGVYDDYIAALAEVVPPDRTAAEIKVRPGAPWIPAAVVAQFAEETFGLTGVTADHVAGRWAVEIPTWKRHGRLLAETWGLPGKGLDAVSLLEAQCNSRSVVVNFPDGSVNREATFAAQAKCTKINEEFARWIFADPARTDALLGEYNRRFRSLVAPRYDGTHLPLPGLSEHFQPHPHQRDAIARIIAEPNTLVDHVVGAGKSGVLILAAYQLRRLGLARQPWVVVPNHICEQFSREARLWAPAARILVGQPGTTPESRRTLIAQSATSEWDMVIVPQSLFKRIGVAEATKAAYIDKQLEELREQLETASVPRTKKRIELAIKNTEKRLKSKLSQTPKDTGLTWENTGADLVLIDEAHHYKNLQRICGIEELSYPDSSERAADLALKLDVLRRRRRDEARRAGIDVDSDTYVERVATFATGTPIANSLGELWVMQKYLRPDLLAAAGVAELGDWGAAFTATHSTVEVNATGTKLRPVTRVGKYTNLPDLLTISSVFTDVVTRDQVPAKLPVLRGGRRRVIALQADTEVGDFIADLGWRMDNLNYREPSRDNSLKIATDGRNISLDPRLAHMDAPQNSRADAVADQIMRIHAATAENTYTDPETKRPLPARGGLQIVFCDRGTPTKDPDQFTIYAAIKDELVARGMAADKVRFVHEARKPTELRALFSACNRGEVSVLIGSTEKMGTGANIQTRAVALHHVDVPWRPADLEQREGRILRQGNQNGEVEILTYVTEGTYDTVMWQKVQAKALFIEQVRRGDGVESEVDSLDGGDIGTAAAETKAVATGDPRYLRQVELEDTVKRLEALERAHHESLRRRDWLVAGHERSLPQRRRDVEELTPVAAAVAQRTAEGHAPEIVIAATPYPDAGAAAEAFTDACRRAFDEARDRASSQFLPIGASIGGLDVVAARDHINGCLLVRLAVPSRFAEISREDLIAATDAGGVKARGLMTRLENIYAQLPRHLHSMRADLDRDQSEYDDLLANPPEPFAHTGELTDRRAELAGLTLDLKLAAESPAALAAAAAAADRMAARGRKPGWSLLHNPTPFVVDEAGFPDAATMRAAVKAAEHTAMRAAIGTEVTAGTDRAALDEMLDAPNEVRDNPAVGAGTPQDTSARAGQVHRMREELAVIESAGGRSPAAAYAPPRESDLTYGDSGMALPDPVRAAVGRITGSAMSVQVLTMGEDWKIIPADRGAVIKAVSLTAHRSDAKVLAIRITDTDPRIPPGLPATSAGRYAHHRATSSEAIDKLSTGVWTLPPGSLVIIDAADHLDAEHLRWFTANAAATNTKLLLVTDDTAAAGANRALTDALADTLSWSTHLGNAARRTSNSALARYHHAADRTATVNDATHPEATALLSRRDTLAAEYTRRSAPLPARDIDRPGPTRDTGLSL